MSINNIDGNGQIQQSNQQQDNSRILFTKEKFTNSIMSALGKSGATTQQVKQFNQQAGSIFDNHDVNGDSKWSEQEANNGGSVALANFYQMVNNALKGITQSQDVDSTEEAKINDIKGMNADEQADAIGQVLEQFLNDGGKITAFDGDNLTIVDKNGVEHKESLSSMGMSKEGIEALKPFIQASVIGNDIDNSIDKGIDVIVEAEQKQFETNSLNVAKKYYKQHGGIPQATFDSSTMTGIMTFPDGFVVKIDNYGNEIKQ